ncbi:nedd4-binding protein 2-like 2 [Limosa lapponica baueri]|uniref:Nedd4-binding protein 2-like 2 n=1 Tax=Limosa lapponica baueri TaxID=1758121 RepID=A0A2I0TUE3_LIMLA|nr:nedd4-binding protein 2-like 2 [Limosa lapponica baueri]
MTGVRLSMATGSFRRDRRGSRGGGIALYIRKWIEFEDLSLKNSHEQVESLWVRNTDHCNKGILVAVVYYRPPDQGEPTNEVFLLHLWEALRSQALIQLGGLELPNICWKSCTVICRQSRRLLECIEGNCLSQVTDSPTRGDVILDLMVTNASTLISDSKIGGSLGCSDHALVGFPVLWDMGQVKSKARSLNFRKENFQMFKEFSNRIPWEIALRDKGAKQPTDL